MHTDDTSSTICCSQNLEDVINHRVRQIENSLPLQSDMSFTASVTRAKKLIELDAYKDALHEAQQFKQKMKSSGLCNKLGCEQCAGK